jgi:hypothetical protein
VLEPYAAVSTIAVSQDNSLLVLLKRDIDFEKKNHFPAVAFKLKE